MAFKKDADLVLARANLGLAYLVHPAGKKPIQALKYFQAATKQNDKRLDGLNRAALLVNHGVAELAHGQPKPAAEKFRQARKWLADDKSTSALPNQLSLALLYNEALLDAANPHSQAKAFDAWEQYLCKAPRSSTWWNLAWEQYQKLGKEIGRKPQELHEIAKRNRTVQPRVLVSVEVAPGKQITLGEATVETVKLVNGNLDTWIPLAPSSKLRRYCNVVPGIDLLGDHKVLAIFVTSAKAPPIFVQSQGLGSKKQELRVGMATRECDIVLKEYQSEARFVDHHSVEYCFYPTLGLGVRFANDSTKVSELVLAQVPRKSSF